MPETTRCGRCFIPIEGEQGCAASGIRRYDGNFDRFRQVARRSGPDERERTSGSG